MLGKLSCYVARVSIFLIAAALIAGMVGCDGYTPPSLSQNLEIWTWYDLDDVRNNLAGNHTLMNDLDSTTAGYEELASPTANEGKGWESIGIRGVPFTGSFDGQGYEIRDMFITRLDERYVGLFGYVGEGGVVEDIGVVNVTVIGDCYVGGLVGHSDGTVSNSYSTGSVIGVGWVGSLVGFNEEGTVSNSYSTGNVTGYYRVGDLVGVNNGAVSNSYSTGSVTGGDIVGGLVGQNGGTVSDSYSTGSVTGNWSVGGLVGWIGWDGWNGGTVSNSYYSHDEVLINGKNIITIGALFAEDFEQWLANDKFLDINERLSQEDGYYLINDVSDFKQLLAFGQDDSLKFRLKNDLDLETEANFYIPYFTGEFDGNGHKIRNPSFNSGFISQLGLFGYLASGGRVSEVGVENGNITGRQYLGGLVGWNGGTVSNSYSTGSVAGNWSVGGLVGWNGGTVSNSYSTGSMTGEYWVGGLLGENEGTVSNSYSTGSVAGEVGVGGLVGRNHEGTVSNSYSTGSVTGELHLGGLVGYNGYWGTVSNSYSSGNVTGDQYVGGLVGYNDHWCTVSNSYSTGSVTGSSQVGGLVGRNYESTVSNSFWDIETSGQPTSAGGIGKTTAEMKGSATFSGAGWNIIAVALGQSSPPYIWNIVNGQTYPFLSWES